VLGFSLGRVTLLVTQTAELCGVILGDETDQLSIELYSANPALILYLALVYEENHLAPRNRDMTVNTVNLLVALCFEL
jgi:hypothetical protein